MAILSSLYFQIIIQIFSFLGGHDRMLAGMTCRRWKEATQYPYATEIALTFAKVNFADTQMPAKLFLNSTRDFPVMSFEAVDFGPMQEFWEHFGESVRELNFKLCEVREKKFLTIMRNVSSLDTLRVEGCRELFMSGRLFESGEDKKDMTAAFRTLRTLSLAHNRYLSDALFSRIVALTTSLENLDLSGCCILFHKGLYKKFYPAAQLEPSESVLTFHYISQFLEHCAAKIKQLNFSSTLIDGSSLNILSEIENLRLDSLNLKACDQLTNPGILSLVAKQTHLQYLDLSMSLRITDQSLIAIADTLVDLKSLKIRRCRALTDLGVKELVKLANLEVLDISECESISGLGITTGIASKVNPRGVRERAQHLRKLDHQDGGELSEPGRAGPELLFQCGHRFGDSNDFQKLDLVAALEFGFVRQDFGRRNDRIGYVGPSFQLRGEPDGHYLDSATFLVGRGRCRQRDAATHDGGPGRNCAIQKNFAAQQGRGGDRQRRKAQKGHAGDVRAKFAGVRDQWLFGSTSTWPARPQTGRLQSYFRRFAQVQLPIARVA
jgi:Leucine Rich repeat